MTNLSKVEIMKKILLILMMTLMSFNFIEAKTYIDDHKYSNKELYVINVNIPVKLKIYSGEDFSYEVYTNDNDLKNDVKCEMKDKNINIFIDNKSLYYNTYNNDEWSFDENVLNIKLTIPENYYDKVKIKTNSNNLLVKNLKINSTKDYENE